MLEADEDRSSETSIPQSPSSPSDDRLIGTTISNKLRVDSLLGHGGMASVYKAHHLSLNKDVALKILHDPTSRSKSALRLQQEARALSGLSHPNLAKFLDFGVTDDGDPYLVIELLEGQTLQQKLERECALPLEEALSIFFKVSDGIAFAHKNRVVHRDLKPSNIMLKQAGDDLQVTVFDFGIARLESEELNAAKLTQTGDIFGSPLYMSPEQVKGAPVDHRSDIYSLGCVLFEMLTGKPPFQGQNAFQTMIMHVSEEIPKPTDVRADLPVELNVVIERMLNKDPEDRYTAIAEPAFDLRSIEKGTGAKSLLPAETNTAIRKQKKRFLTGSPRAYSQINMGFLLAYFACTTFFVLALLGFVSKEYLLLTVALPPIVLMSFILVLLVRLFEYRSHAAFQQTSGIDIISEQLRPINRLIAANMRVFGEASSPSRSQLGCLNLGYEISTSEELSLTKEMREHNPHVLIVGRAGSGKSDFLTSIIARDTDCARVIVDTKGDLTDLLTWYYGRFDEPVDDRLTVIRTDSDSSHSLNCLDFPQLDMTARLELLVCAFKMAHATISSAEFAWCAETDVILRLSAQILEAVGRPLDDINLILSEVEFRLKVIAEARALNNKETSACAEALLELAAERQFKSQSSPILDVAMSLASDSRYRKLFFPKGAGLDLISLLSRKKTVVLCAPAATGDIGAAFAASLLVAYFRTATQYLYDTSRQTSRSVLYIDGLEHCFDHQLFKELTDNQMASMERAVIAATRSLERFSPRDTDLILSRIGLGCIFKSTTYDSLLLGKRLLPVSSIYTGNTDTITAVKVLRARMEAQNTGEYFAWLREATAGLFHMKLSKFRAD